MRREIDRFRAISEDGKEYTIVVFQNLISAPNEDNPHAVLEGLQGARTTDGYAVNIKDETTFEIVNDPSNLGLIVHKV